MIFVWAGRIIVVLWVFVVRMLMCVRYCGESDFLNQFGSGKGGKCEIPVF